VNRRLFIIRHAKSSWDYEGLADIHRPLSERGIRNASTMAHRLQDLGMIPELLLSSPATRALNTALIMSRVWGLPPAALQIHDAIYEAYPGDLDQVLAVASPRVKALAIYGHNPTFTMYSNQFLEKPLDNLPTAGVTIVSLESEGWSGLDRSMVTETYVDYPKRKV
jgi:phosphohistidine phosphatase